MASQKEAKNNKTSKNNKVEKKESNVKASTKSTKKKKVSEKQISEKKVSKKKVSEEQVKVVTEDIKHEDVKQENAKKSEKNFWSFYISFNVKLLCYFALFLMLLLFGIYQIFESTSVVQKEVISFIEQGNVSYSVCLVKNKFYTEKCLGMNQSYVATLIDNIPLKFNYKFGGNSVYVDKPIKYRIIGTLVIKNSDTSSKYFEKEYVLKDYVKNDNADGNFYNISDEITIDYDYYNQIANTFKSNYGVDIDSYLNVSLMVYNEIDKSYNIPDSSSLSIKIPLSLKTIQISTLDVNNESSHILEKNHFNINNLYLFVFGCFLIGLSIVSFVFFISLFKKRFRKKSIYDKILAKYLKEYDRLIVATKSLPNFSDYNLLKIDSFGELVDVRDNLRLPIMYYNVVSHSKSYFYVLQDSNLYLYTLKEVDLIANEEKKNKQY